MLKCYSRSYTREQDSSSIDSTLSDGATRVHERNKLFESCTREQDSLSVESYQAELH